jgi:hypothetical protein
MSLYDELKSAGVELDNHESDLYAKVCPESTNIIHRAGKVMPEVFISELDKMPWYDIPFAFDPWWIKRTGHA